MAKCPFCPKCGGQTYKMAGKLQYRCGTCKKITPIEIIAPVDMENDMKLKDFGKKPIVKPTVKKPIKGKMMKSFKKGKSVGR